MIRMLMFVGLAVVGLVVAGAIHIQQNGNMLEVNVDEKKLEETVEEVIKDGKAVISKTASAKGGGISR